MPSIAKRLIAEERRIGNDADPGSRAAFRVCEKLRRPLATFAGAAGYRSLLSRALKVASGDAPLLGEVQVKPDGTIEFSAEMEAQLDTELAAKAGAALAHRLLGLLVTLIGEALTLRLAREVWPKAALENLESEET